MPSEKFVKNFMRSLDHYSYIKEDETVQAAVRLMDKVRKEGTHQCLFVVGEEQYEKQFIKGFVTPSELVFGLSAHFLKGAQKSGPVFWEGQLEAECMEGLKKHVREIMVPFVACVGESNMLMEAVFLFNKYHIDFLPVVNRDDVVGMIHIHEISAYIAELALGIH
ncbi:MAG: CBS domain-containing protein [Desulfobacterales bacterium]|nr:CBS domain-containing protein [Desulfobacterales bacterium]